MSFFPFYGLLCASTSQPQLVPAAAVAVLSSQPDIHLNIWEQGDKAFLDIGLMIDVDEQSATYELLLPWTLRDSNLEDLYGRITNGIAVPAIFNEAWAITTQGNNAYVSDPVSGAKLFTIVPSQCQVKTHVHNQTTLYAVSIDINVLKAKSLQVAPTAPKFYVRLRVADVPKSFYCVGINQEDRLWVSSTQRTEIIDFRLNVRRGAPIGVEQSVGRLLTFSKVHLFLMRSRAQDIVFEDPLFRGCRSLEDEAFWAEYSLPKTATSDERENAAENIKNSLGYQWTKTAKMIPTTLAGPSAGQNPLDTFAPVTEFGILARFKVIRFGIKKFVVIALLVGALGNVLWDGVKTYIGNTLWATAVQGWIAAAPILGGRQ